MVWFYCDDCGDSIKKPKLAQHLNRCSASSFTCIDCSRVFDQGSVHGHVKCVTEHEKYAQGATKPGGFAADGFYDEGAAAGPALTAPSGEAEPVGAQFLAGRPPWRCSVCNVTCTSQSALAGHASGAKHVRKARAALRAAGGGDDAAASAGAANGAAAGAAAPARPADPPAPAKPAAAAPASPQQEPSRSKAAGKPRWRALAKAELKRRGGSAKAKRLAAAVLAAAAAQAGGAPAALSQESLLAKLSRSPKFVVEGKLVRLAPRET